MEISYRDVIEINKMGLTYKHKSEIHHVNFKTCRDNWIKYVNSSSEFKGIYKNPKGVKCVGQRNVCSSPMYIELFDNERLKIIMDIKQSLLFRLLKLDINYQYQAFKKISDNIISNEWSTFDLS